MRWWHLRRLGSIDTRVRLKAVQGLAQHHDSNTLSRLVNVAIEDGDAEVRIAALQYLKQTGKPAIIELLDRLKSNSNKLGAVSALLEIGPLGERALLDFSNTSPNRPYFLRLLVQSGMFSAIDPLIQACAQDSQVEQDWVIETLLTIKDSGLCGLVEALNHWPRSDALSKALIGVGANATNPIVQRYSQLNPPARSVALLVLCEVGDNAAAEILVEGLRDVAERNEDTIRFEKALHRIGISVVDPLLTLVDCSSNVRERAISVLESIGDPSVVPFLERLLSHPDFEVRARICRSLGYRGASSLDCLCKALQDSSIIVRTSAAAAIYLAIQRADRMTKLPRWIVDELVKAFLAEENAQDLTEVIISALKKLQPLVSDFGTAGIGIINRAQAKSAFAHPRNNEPKAANAVSRILKSGINPDSLPLPELPESIGESLLHESDSRKCKILLEGLLKTSRRRLIPIFAQLLNHRDLFVRKMVLREIELVLRTVAMPTAEEVTVICDGCENLLKRRTDPETCRLATQILKRIDGRGVLVRLERIASSAQPGPRLRIADVLHDFGAEALPLLCRLLSDNDLHVREQAMKTLRPLLKYDVCAPLIANLPFIETFTVLVTDQVSEDMALGIIEFFGVIADLRSAPVLTRFFSCKEGSFKVRAFAAQVLHRMNHKVDEEIIVDLCVSAMESGLWSDSIYAPLREVINLSPDIYGLATKAFIGVFQSFKEAYAWDDDDYSPRSYHTVERRLPDAETDAVRQLCGTQSPFTTRVLMGVTKKGLISNRGISGDWHREEIMTSINEQRQMANQELSRRRLQAK